MYKKEYIIGYKVLCALTALFIVAGSVYYFISSKIYLATRPCVFMYVVELAILAGAAVFFAASALPGKLKINAKRDISAALIKWSITVSACFSIMNAFFMIRVEYSGNLDLISDDMQRFLLMLFYLALLRFALKPSHVSRMAAVILGIIYAMYALLVYTLFYHQALDFREITMVVSVAMWVLTLAGFTNIKRSYYASPISKTDLYAVARFETKAGFKCAIVKDGFEGDVGVFSYDTELICMMDSPYDTNAPFDDEDDQNAWLDALSSLREEEQDAHEGII